MYIHGCKRTVLAFGAESKGRFAVAGKEGIVLSEEFGSLQDYVNFERYERSLRRSLKWLTWERPAVLACDMHPDYSSSVLAEELAGNVARLVRVQHHHAHIASSMAEHGLNGNVIGVAFDGTGYGLDGNIWGGEFLLASYMDFKRAAHLKYIPMAGGDKAAEEPWRMAAAYLREAFGVGFLKIGIPITKMIDKGEWRLLEAAIEKNVNSPLTSSAGRLFDAVASIVLGISKVKTEAEAAIALQNIARRAADEQGVYDYLISKDKAFSIDMSPTVKKIVRDMKSKVDPAVIAMRFHNTMTKMIADVCARIRRSSRLNRVILSGGVFQNSLLARKASVLLSKKGFTVYMNSEYSPSDAGIAAGQAAVAYAVTGRG